MDAWQPKIPSNHTIKPNTTTSVRRDTDAPENRQVLFDTSAVRVDSLRANPSLEFNGIVNPLTARKYFLIAGEEIEGIRDLNTITGSSVVNFGIEWSCCLWELVDNEKVGSELGTDYLAERLLLRGTHILVITNIGELWGSFLS
jgi:hypothetical protein